ncbi:phasin family protein [Geothermobacter hydrogeniphilus]|uniref:Phasin superfamily protein n=1 Tax=Geothermobacter hydrogeniphilus TaxID=1969733 RepID=A0A1X0Y5K4_9BACT|nr:phasin family protein [Geothermobacter hydrogeniphilus]ORJ60423.1 phasin superfamily protein [Geothermobacter hydrogeniphilus]
MLELIEKTVLTAMGAVSMTQKKAEEMLEELKQRCNLSEEEGKDLLQRLQGIARENQSKLQEMAQQEVHKACQRMGVVTTEEFEKLRKKVTQLEKKLRAQSR